MKLVYYRDGAGNFGDDLNPWLWSRLLGDLLDEDPREHFFGIGTIIGFFPELGGDKHVFGSGIGYRDIEPDARRDWRFHMVRGPLTAARLGLDPAVAVTDPALLLAALPWPASPRRHRVAYMPHHHGAAAGPWAEIAGEAGLAYIDPRWGPMRCLHEIRASELLVTEAMHGAIVADAFGIPWIPVKLYPWVLDFKWHDWCATIGVDHAFERPLPWSAMREVTPTRDIAHAAYRWTRRRSAALSLRLVARARPRLSAEGVRTGLIERLLAMVSRFREQVRERHPAMR